MYVYCVYLLFIYKYMHVYISEKFVLYINVKNIFLYIKSKYVL